MSTKHRTVSAPSLAHHQAITIQGSEDIWKLRIIKCQLQIQFNPILITTWTMKQLTTRRIHVNCSPTLSMSPAVRCECSRLDTGTTAHRSTCTVHGTEDSTAVQCNTVDLQFARCNLYFNALYKSKWFAICTVQAILQRTAMQHTWFATCIVTMLQCNICDMQFSVLFTLYGAAVIQTGNLHCHNAAVQHLWHAIYCAIYIIRCCSNSDLQFALSQRCSATFVTCNLLCYLHYTLLR